MEKTISKKIFAGLLALSAGCVLAACDPISSTPTSYNDPILVNDSGEKIDYESNLMGKFYDAISSEKNSQIVSEMLEDIAVNRFGSYAELDAAFKLEADGTVTHKDGYDAYVTKYGAEFDKKDDVEGQKAHRLELFYKDVMSRISEFFYNEITSGTYNDEEGRFDEQKLYLARFYEFFDIIIPDGAKPASFFVTSDITKENAFSKLHYVYSNSGAGKKGYIEEKVYPQILKDKLVEEYVYDNNFNSLGRSYARKVSYIKISYEDDTFTRNLFQSFGEECVEQNETVWDFETISKAIKGYESVGSFSGDDGIVALSEGKALTILKAALNGEDFTYDDETTGKKGNAVKVTDPIVYGSDTLVPAASYYKKTKLGAILEKYEMACRAEDAGRFANADDKAELDSFTANDKSKEYGLREKLIELAKEDYTTDGWFIKNGGLSELPSALRDRLFNISVANVLDNADKLVLETKDNLGAYEKDPQTGKTLTKRPYLRNVYGRKFVITADCSDFKDDKYSYFYQDVEGKAIYMVEVLEAPSTPKLSKDQPTSYAKIDAEHPFRTEEIARQVAKVLGTKDSYIKNAYTELLNKCHDFVFYDTSLYEYLKSEYPDLDIFEE